MAFESSLLILPTSNCGTLPSLYDWNLASGWRAHYNIPTDVLFFAMDAFGVQFGIASRGVVRLEPESGDLSLHSRDLECWAAKILEDFDFETGYSVAHEWQLENGRLGVDRRLVPLKPFVLGGEFCAGNVVAWPIQDIMEQYGRLHAQISRVPDGEAVTVNGWLMPE